MSKYLITGGKGMLAYAIINHPFFKDHCACDVEDFNICDKDQMVSVLEKEKPEYVINCAAYTDVTKAETEYDKAYQINATGAKNLAELSLAYQFKLIHISTDFVFPGNKEIEKSENDETQPVNAYGKSKLEGEVFVNAIAKDHLILRVSWLYGPNGRNFVSIISQLIKTKDELNIVADQYGKTTYTVDVAEVLSHLITKQANGIYHFANQGVSSRYEFTQEIYRLIKEYEEVDCTIKPMKAIDYPDPTPRPSYSVLNTDKISQLID
ncbi:MAG TPA: dTDP-4-dehydrorhamnose reductase, partial [Candidatus Cloacimonadota bacterium]|nr:dTDP-4-dehydrorhamnose reductase [Candidatus Cloacimonadota bacterium]